MRHLQMVNIYGTNIVYVGATPATVNAVAGNVPQGSWIDFSDDVDDITKLRLAWSEKDPSKDSNTAGANGNPIKRTTSGTIKLTNAAYQFLKAWCVDDVAAPLNAVEVRIDMNCGSFERYKISADQLRWCEGEFICEFDVTLSQIDPAMQCIQRTVVSDNWQGWFQEVPSGGKKHPRFSYCNEARPNALLIGMWILMSILMPVLYLLLILAAIVLVVINIINLIIGVITTIASLLSIGGVDKPEWNTIPEYKLSDFINGIKTFFVESTGCGREHPSPLIRDYIVNVCAKCGVTVDATTAPMFFSPTWNIDFITSTGVNLRGQANPYYNACYFNAPVSKGVRRFRSLNFFSSVDKDDTTFYITKNAPYLALNDFLDELAPVFNAEWRLKNGKLYFWRKDWYLDSTVLYDFSTGATDRRKILEGVCFEWNEIKMPAFSKGLWSKDTIDTCGDENLGQMNGKGGEGLVTYASTENNPLFKGEDNRKVKFGGTRFRFDGSAGDYIYDAMQAVVNFAAYAPYTAGIMRDIDTWISEYANYALLLRDEVCNLPKIIIWDGGSYLAAKTVLNTVPTPNYLTTTEPVPAINPKYNPDPSNAYSIQSWVNRHVPQSKVLGNLFSVPLGVYQVKWFFGSLVAQNSARLANYPMYYEPGYLGTLWDLFHYIDDPRIKPKLNRNFEVKIELCCEDLTRLKLLGDGSNVELGAKVLLESQYYPVATIDEIELNIDPTDALGSYITIKGTQ